MRIHHINAGTMCPRGARFIDGHGGLFARATMVCHCLLIETNEGLVMVDGGIGMGDIARPDRLGPKWVRMVSPRLDPNETALARVRALGFSENDVRHIVLTHLDLDHAGSVPDFPHATVHVHARELAAATARSGPREKRRYVPEQIPGLDRVRSYEDGGDGWFGFDGVRAFSEKNSDILMVPLPGHTAGHSAIAVRDGGRWLLHAGDGYFFHGQMANPPHAPLGLRWFQGRADHDGRARARNQERLRRVALDHADQVTVFCAHDPVEMNRSLNGVTASIGT